MSSKYLIPSLFLLLGACAPKSDQDHFSNAPRPLPQLGTLRKNVYELLASEYTSRCDESQHQQMLELSSDLDSRKDGINELIRSQPTDDEIEKIPFGKSFLRNQEENKNAKDEWRKFEEGSWTQAYQRYLKIKDQPLNRDWLELNSDVRSLIVNDQKRLKYGDNLQLVHDSGERIKPLLTAVKACFGQKDCKSLALSEADRKFALEENDIYSWYMTKLESSFDEKILENFLKRLEFDFSGFEMRRNTSISIQEVGGKKILRLPVTGVDFDNVQKDLIRQSVEKVWSGDDLALQLEWLAPDPSVFRMIFDLNRPGERAGVAFDDKIIEIFPLTSVRAVAHEFGHVLGFMDKYYTTFDQKTCSYVIEYNPGDIMSMKSGRITPEEWKTLKETYSGN